MDRNLFQNPPKSFREIPFWSWNDDLDPEELVRQIDLMDKAGWGGFFMHARVGLKTPYMGKRWMECIRASTEAARQRGMTAWLYDEDKWPSGYAGGLSLAAHPEYRSQCLICKVDDKPALLAERVATFYAREIEGQLVDFRRDDHPDLVDERDRVVQFFPMTMALGQEKFNFFSYLDLMNPDAVQAFLASTHQAYAELFSDEFGKTIPGIFTDEPCFIFRNLSEKPGFTFLPWTNGFGEYFQAQNGYDLLPHLPALFFPGIQDSSAYRYDFFRTALRRFIDSFTRPVSQWCARNNLAYTGHYMAEDTLLEQIHWTGASMPQYPYMQLPGIDKLFRHVNGFCSMVLTVKQLDSVVSQMGKTRALCENYGAAGQDFAHTGRKWLGDWSYVLGITLNNPHLSLYSMRGDRKRDCPQHLSYQQPWWPENNLIADYFARLSYLLSQGQRVVDIVLIHPIGSAWAVFQPGSTTAVDELDERLDQLNMVLVEHQRDFHFADENLVAPDGGTPAKVVKSSDGPRLQIGKMAYRLVIVPSGVTLATTTVNLLAEFAAAGGPVLALDPAPTLIDGRPPKQPVLPPSSRLFCLKDLPVILDDLLPFDLRIPEQPEIWAHHRQIDGIDCYFLANINPDKGITTSVDLRASGRLEEWDPATGAVVNYPSQSIDGITRVVLEFAPAGSHLLMLHPGESPQTVSRTSQKLVFEKRLASEWEFSTDDLNALPLDSARLKVGNGPWSRPRYILDIGQTMASKGVGTPFGLSYDLNLNASLPQPIYLVLESPERFKISINGKAISCQDCGWWVDIAFRKIDISAALQPGRNEIGLESTYQMDTELETIYITGKFGVRNRRIGFEKELTGQIFDRYSSRASLVPQVTRVVAEERHDGVALDLTAAGLPFFAGRARLVQTLTLPAVEGKAFLEFTNLRTAVAPVRVNGVQVGTCAWQPHRIDLGRNLAAGENHIEIELVGTLRNLLGPHHQTGGDSEGTGPGNFNNKSVWTDDTILVPLGFDGVILKIYSE